MPLASGGGGDGDGISPCLSAHQVFLVLRVAPFSVTERLASENFGPLFVMRSVGSTIIPTYKANAVIKDG